MSKILSNLSALKSSKGILSFSVVAIIAFFSWSYFKTPEIKPTTSVISGNSMNTNTVQAPADKPVDPEYGKALSQADSQRANEALETGKSAVPTIVSQNPDTQAVVTDLLDPKDKTPELKEPTADIVQQPLALTPTIDAVPIVTTPPPVVAAASPEKTNAMIQFLARRPNPVAEVVDFGYEAKEVASAEQTSPSVSNGDTDQTTASKIKLPLAGTILYAQLVGRADSDHPGPVLAKILQGEYTGATLIGTFANSNNALSITFDQMTVEKTRSGEEVNEVIPIEAVAVDTKYIGTGLATSVDRHLFQKLAIAFTSGFAQGFGEAVVQKGQTTIDTGNGTITTGTSDLNTTEELTMAGGQAIGQAGSILQQEFGNMPTTVIVEAGTPIGVLFMK